MVGRRVLCVAEKPSIARSITAILSGGQFSTRETGNRYIRNFDFVYGQANSHFTVTAVSGHLMEHDFGSEHRNWRGCDPFSLFDAPVFSSVAGDKKTIERNLIAEARNAQTLMIWTDCDREGENIGMEVANVCRKANRQIIVQRARFSAIIAQQIHRAAQNPVELDRHQADAVEARTILDLRLGAAFTRMQSMALQSSLPQLDNKMISYGPCQFPTLGFVVSRYKQVQAFRPEQFWFIYLLLGRTGEAAGASTEQKKGKKPQKKNKASNGEDDSEGSGTRFNWKRGHIFDFDASLAIYEAVLADPIASVTSVRNKETKKWKPLPLTTVELQKAGSRLLRMAPKKVLDIAEQLYQQGFLSYPRTETDQFDSQFDFHALIEKQRADPAWGAYAAHLKDGDGFAPPRRGKKDDKAHPPIHPTAHVMPEKLNADQKKVYEFVTRRFLAACSNDAEGWETTVDVLCGGEEFSASGLVVLRRNYLDVYPYDKWGSKELPHFEEGEQFMPSVCELRDGETSKPNLLMEADLVTLMDKNGIGTDATIAQHIQTIVDREYVIERVEGSTKYLVPSTLGIGLVDGYNRIGFDRSLSKPVLRRETERTMVQVCEGEKTKNDMLEQSIEQYKEVFIKARREFNQVVTSVRDRLDGANGADENGPAQAPPPNGPGGDGPGRRGGGGGGGRGRGRRPDSDGDDGEYKPAPGPLRGRGRGKDKAAGPSTRTRKASASKATTAERSALAAPIVVDSDEEYWKDDPISDLAFTQLPAAQPSRAPDSEALLCRCEVPAGERTVTKETGNKGRQFWMCGDMGKCDFFEWKDGLGTAGHSSSQTVPAKRLLENRSMNTEEGVRMCKCSLTAVSRTVSKEGSNKGRTFWCCPNSEKARCTFFEWDDEPPREATSPYAGLSGGMVDASDECYKCGGTGHWASVCPNPGGGRTKPKKTSHGGSHKPPAFGTGGQADLCYKCGRKGHWSSACPNPFGGNIYGYSGGSRRGRGRGKTRTASRGRGRARSKSGLSAADDW